jgi:hypothetical protein
MAAGGESLFADDHAIGIMRFWQRLRYIEVEREAVPASGLTTRCSRRRAAGEVLKSRGRAPAAAERERWTVSDHDFPESGFGRIFSRTK